MPSFKMLIPLTPPSHWGRPAAPLSLDLAYLALSLPQRGFSGHPTLGQVSHYNSNSSFFFLALTELCHSWHCHHLSCPLITRSSERAGMALASLTAPMLSAWQSLFTSEHRYAFGGHLLLRVSRLCCTKCLV